MASDGLVVDSSALVSQDARPLLNTLLSRLTVQVVPFTVEHAKAAIEAFVRYGKGRHPAALNFGDCQSYAIAAIAGMPLLFTGNDFARTDITPALL